MVCLVCSSPSGGRLCSLCRASMRPAVPRVVCPGLVALSAFVHDGSARALVHRLKYQAVLAAAQVLSAAMVPLLPGAASALVPVPRSLHRRLVLGVDPAVELAYRISQATGLPVVRALRAPVVAARHAGRARSRRDPPSFGRRGALPVGAVLLDDVLTTGSTLRAAAARLDGGLLAAVTATAVPPLTSLTEGERGWPRSRPGLQMED